MSEQYVAWLNASKSSRVSVGMNRSVRGCSVKRIDRPNGLDTVLYKDHPFTFLFSLAGQAFSFWSSLTFGIYDATVFIQIHGVNIPHIKECGLTTLETQRLRGDHVEVQLL